MSAIETIRDVSFPELTAIKDSLIEDNKDKETNKDDLIYFASTQSLDLPSLNSSSYCFTDIAFYISECHKQLLEIPPEV